MGQQFRTTDISMSNQILGTPTHSANPLNYMWLVKHLVLSEVEFSYAHYVERCLAGIRTFRNRFLAVGYTTVSYWMNYACGARLVMFAG